MNEHPAQGLFNVRLFREESKGLYDKSQHTVECPGCNKHLVTIKTVDDRDIALKHTIVCPYCSEESFIVETEGSYIYDLPDDNVIAGDIVYETKDSVKLFLRKKNAR